MPAHDFKGRRRRPQRSDARWVVGGLLVLLVLFVGVLYFFQRTRDLPSFLANNQVLLFVLWYVDIILIVVILFVLLRNLFKLMVERRHRMLGSKFKVKLVLTFIGLSLIPVLLLFTIATELLQGSVDRWFTAPVQEVLEQGAAVAEELVSRIEKGTLRDASQLLQDIRPIDLADPQQRPELGDLLRQRLQTTNLAMVAVYDERVFIQAAIDPQAGITDLPELPADFLSDAAATGWAVRPVRQVPGQSGRLILAAAAGPPAPAPDESGGDQAAPPPRPIVVAGALMAPSLAEKTERLIDASQSYRQLEVQREDLKASHLLTFLMVTLLILLASSWVGLYLARRVTVPIQALADGTRRISLGDLDHRVEVAADDELGVLVDSFNRMTQELKRNKEVIEQSNLELVAANERLAEERALIGAVLENVAAGVISTDAAGRIFTCNGAALRMLRQRESEVIGLAAADAWRDPERRKVADLLSEELENGHLARELHLVLGGEWKTFDAKVTAIDDGESEQEEGAPGEGESGRVIVLEDLTELIKAQQLAAWNEAARRIAHEIKNPLTPIKLSAERLLYKSRQEDPALGKALEEAVEIITREVASMQSMVDEFSRYARMPGPRPTSVDVRRLIHETIHLYRDLKPGVAVRGNIPTELPAAQLDAEQIKRALINLIDNALEATDAPGVVEVSAERRTGTLYIHVADSGRGVPVEARGKLFLPHFSTKGRGTGLGLSIVQRIITEHHGTIRVEANEPHGTIFTIELPS
ncbi:MAG: ATP-binding protein [Acidobacteriota bacterium]